MYKALHIISIRYVGFAMLCAALMIGCSDGQSPVFPEENDIKYIENVTSLAKTGHTEIMPSQGDPGQPFTIIDAPDGRLILGTVAVFRSGAGAETQVSLRIHRSHKTAQGRVPISLPGGEYTVFVRQPNGATIDIGSFFCTGDEPEEPTIEPTEGPVGTFFVIFDPHARIESGDIAVFYREFRDPSEGTPAVDVEVSADGKTLTGKVPLVAAPTQYFVSVTPVMGIPGRFGDLPFFVTSDDDGHGAGDDDF